MTDRLIVGKGSLVQTLVEELAARGSAPSVAVAADGPAGAFGDREVDAETLAITDPAALAERYDPEVVFVVADAAVARAARRAFPEAYIVGYGPRRELDAIVDRVVDPVAAVAGAALEQIGPSGRRAGRLRGVLRGLDSLAVVTHDSPDPDAIASGTALAALADDLGCRAGVLYAGRIAHHENQALVNLLDLDLQAIEGTEALAEYDGVALVDHSRPGVNDQLSLETPIDIVIDHHPASGPTTAEFTDVRSEVGATSTLLVEYLDEFGLDPPEPIATALLFGILVDTNEFVRGVSPADFEAAAWLVPRADFDRVEQIESPSMSASALETVGAAIRNRTVEDGLVITWAGSVSRRTAIAQAADRLLELEGASTVAVIGVRRETVHVSARSRGGFDVGELLREAFGAVGSAGGHVDMAGAQIELSALATPPTGAEAENDHDDSEGDSGVDPEAARAPAIGLLRRALESDHAAAEP
ncbi:DHH family phosphoesterase [Halobacteriales archaeon QH_10_67_13]|nr:MAG: DHH family phosphoesterase [Halobacteriales archaeon QH_10_67_13]